MVIGHTLRTSAQWFAKSDALATKWVIMPSAAEQSHSQMPQKPLSGSSKQVNVLSITGYRGSVDPSAQPSPSTVYAAHSHTVGAELIVGPTSPTIKLQVHVGNSSGWVDCMPDTGADTTVMGNELLGALGLTPDKLQYFQELGLYNPDGTLMPV